MKTEEIRERAVIVHDEGADWFLQQYGSKDAHYSNAFRYGRHHIEKLFESCIAKLPPNARILDVGCGTGDQAKALLNRGFDVFGIEPAPRMREQAVAKLGGDRVTDGSILKLPYPDNHFDFALALEVFRYLDANDNAAGLAEVRRVLKPGGSLFATFVNRWALDGFHTLVSLRKLRGAVTGDGPKAHTEFETPSGLASKLVAAGFTKAETHGAMFAPLRLTYKLGPIGPLMGRIVNPLDRVLSDNAVTKPFAGHLIAIATK